jgi:hypothetical protein
MKFFHEHVFTKIAKINIFEFNLVRQGLVKLQQNIPEYIWKIFVKNYLDRKLPTNQKFNKKDFWLKG